MWDNYKQTSISLAAIPERKKEKGVKIIQKKMTEFPNLQIINLQIQKAQKISIGEITVKAHLSMLQ